MKLTVAPTAVQKIAEEHHGEEEQALFNKDVENGGSRIATPELKSFAESHDGDGDIDCL